MPGFRVYTPSVTFLGPAPQTQASVELLPANKTDLPHKIARLNFKGKAIVNIKVEDDANSEQRARLQSSNFRLSVPATVE
jgi:hypothetical protein